MAQGSRQVLIPWSNPCQAGGHGLPWVSSAGLGVGWLPFSWRGHGLEPESGLDVVQGVLISREMLEFIWLQILWSLLWPCAHGHWGGWYGHGTRTGKVLPPSEPRPGDISPAQGPWAWGAFVSVSIFLKMKDCSIHVLWETGIVY